MAAVFVSAPFRRVVARVSQGSGHPDGSMEWRLGVVATPRVRAPLQSGSSRGPRAGLLLTYSCRLGGCPAREAKVDLAGPKRADHYQGPHPDVLTATQPLGGHERMFTPLAHGDKDFGYQGSAYRRFRRALRATRSASVTGSSARRSCPPPTRPARSSLRHRRGRAAPSPASVASCHGARKPVRRIVVAATTTRSGASSRPFGEGASRRVGPEERDSPSPRARKREAERDEREGRAARPARRRGWRERARRPGPSRAPGRAAGRGAGSRRSAPARPSLSRSQRSPRSCEIRDDDIAAERSRVAARGAVEGRLRARLVEAPRGPAPSSSRRPRADLPSSRLISPGVTRARAAPPPRREAPRPDDARMRRTRSSSAASRAGNRPGSGAGGAARSGAPRPAGAPG